MPSGSNLKAPIEWGVEQRGGFTSVRVLVEQIQLISRKCLNVIGDDVVK